jgi:hypothetical protein
MVTVLSIFVMLNVAGHLSEELDWSNTIGCLILIAGGFTLRHYLGFDPNFLTAAIAVINIGLVFKVLKGDLTIR